MDSAAESSSHTSRVKSKVYTRSGDGGTSSMYTGERRSKSDTVFDALGSVDEANAHVGAARAALNSAEREPRCDLWAMLDSALCTMQNRLFDVGTAIGSCSSTTAATTTTSATPTSGGGRGQIPMKQQHVDDIELQIDTIDSHNAPLTGFVLPSGGAISCNLHIARCVCRRAERSTVSLVESGHNIDSCTLKFLNRASDLLFVAARFAAQLENVPEVLYVRSS